MNAELLRLADEMKDAAGDIDDSAPDHGDPGFYIGLTMTKWAERLRALAAQPAVQDGWMPIESAPKDGTRILAAATGDQRLVLWWDESADNWMLPAPACRNLTHWQPLPPAPQGD